jgi:colanic acid/amylovoran biosynthesis glycosyltransferase
MNPTSIIRQVIRVRTLTPGHVRNPGIKEKEVVIVQNNKRLRVVLFSPLKNAVSETFIKDHIERLPLNVTPRFESYWRLRDAHDRFVWPLGRRLGAVAQRLAPERTSAAFDFFLARHLRRSGADAVLAEYGTTGAYLVKGCKKARVPLFVHFHGFDASVRSVLDAHGAAYKEMFTYASGVIAVSEAMKNRLLGLGARPERLHVNAYGVDPDRFSGGSPETKGPVFLAVGRFVEKKAPYLTVLAFSKIIQAVPAARLLMVGDGPLLGPCKRLAAALGAGSAIGFLGVLDSNRVSELMREARVFVQHSLEADNGDCEGAPVAVIEAQMTGLPVISTRHAGIAEIVVEGETGFLVEEGDMDGMSARMLQLARDPGLAGRMGRAARHRAEVHYTLDRHLGQLAEMIESQVNQKKRLA